MQHTNRKKSAEPFNGTTLLGALLGAVLLTGISWFQDVTAGRAPLVSNATIVPVLFGGFFGLAIAVCLHKYKSASMALLESETKYRQMMDAMADAAYICSAAFRIEYANPAMIARIGRDGIGEPCFRVLHGLDDRCPWCCHDQVMGGNSTTLEIVSPKDKRAYLASSSPIRQTDGTISNLTVLRDVTNIRNMERQLQQSQKMEAIGTLAGGIAHDFNNILAAVIGYTELLQMSLQKESAELEYANQIERAGNRAKELVKQILTFSRQTEHERKPVGIGIIVKEVVKLMRSSLPVTIDIKQSINGSSLVMGNPTQIHQILMNLCTNAGHAMRENGGVLTIELESMELKEELISQRVRLTPGIYVRLTVSDTGHGMSARVLDRVFDPFFTTKSRGEGTGMGLAVVHGIVESYQGAVYAYSEVGQGTTFRVYLPAIERRAEPELRVDDEIPKGDEHILFVDDETMLIQMGTIQLEALGYRVSSRSSSREALDLFERDPDAFDLAITDMTMPDLTGDRLARRIKRIRQDIPIILCTGFSAKLSAQPGPPPDVDALLMKPVVLRDMAHKIREALDGSE